MVPALCVPLENSAESSLLTMRNSEWQLYWHRTDLRLHDSPALHAALDLKPSAFFPTWCWDPNVSELPSGQRWRAPPSDTFPPLTRQYVYKHRVGVNRFRFLLESMQELASSYTSVEALTTLLVVRGEPTMLLPELIKRWKITHLVFESDPTGYGLQRDKAVKAALEDAKLDVQVVEENGHYLYNPVEIVEKHGGKAVTSMSQLQKVLSNFPAPPEAFETPSSLPLPLAPDASKPSDLDSVLKELAKTLEGMKAYKDHPGRPTSISTRRNSREGSAPTRSTATTRCKAPAGRTGARSLRCRRSSRSAWTRPRSA